MSERIIRIEEDVTFSDDLCLYDGFFVVTDQQTIKVGISNYTTCCERWGYFLTNDDLSEFIGAELLEVKLVDKCLSVSKAPEIYEGDVMFVNFETSKGTLQFVAYNEHNGYYGHDAVVLSKQLTTSQLL